MGRKISIISLQILNLVILKVLSQESNVFRLNRDNPFLFKKPSFPQITQQLSLDTSIQGTDINTNDICGTTDGVAPSDGTEIRRGEWPWVMTIFLKKTPGNFQCAGSLISTRFVVTTALCMNSVDWIDFRPEEIILWLGHNSIYNFPKEGAVVANVEHIIIHPDYKKRVKKSHDADIAILKMDRPVSYTKYIRPICLWPATSGIQDVEGTVGSVIGWGEGANRFISEFPRKINLPIINVATCAAISNGLPELVSKRAFCVKNLKENGPCRGDLGGGLAIYRNNRWTLRGLESGELVEPNGDYCKLTEYTVYTDVALFSSWIQSNTHTPIAMSNPNTNVNTNVNTNAMCGTRYTGTAFIYRGTETTHGDWPWMVAIYVNRPSGLSFNCGGTLLNSRSVVTAAHCMRTSSGIRQPREILLWLGRHSLINWQEDGAVVSNVERIFIHPDCKKYSSESFDADIAILTMDRQVSYTTYIRPICLWPATSSIQDVEGSSGTVVGWGRDEFGLVSDFPKKIDLPIVNAITCVQSNHVLGGLISNRTFCAGTLKGDGPCHGDSGGGLVLYRNNQWMLRGIVSSGIKDPETGRCKLTDYVVFTDVSLFSSWILNHI